MPRRAGPGMASSPDGCLTLCAAVDDGSKSDTRWMRRCDDPLQMALCDAGPHLFASERHPGETNSRVWAIHRPFEQHGVSR